MRKMHFGIIGLITLYPLVLGGCKTASTTDPEPPSGGRAYVMDYDVFVAQIDPILTARGCDNISCHGGGFRGTFRLSPDGDKDVDLDYFQVGMQVEPADPAASRLLVKPLAEVAGGVVHTASSEQYGFMSTGDPNYQAILAWIEAGEYR